MVQHGEDSPTAIIIFFIVFAFAVKLHEAIKRDDRARRTECHGTVSREHVDTDLIQNGSFHLACQRTLPDQRVELKLIRVQILFNRIWRAADVRWTYCLVCFLRVLGFGFVFPGRRRQILGPVGFLNNIAGSRDRFARHLHAICSHVGDQTNSLAADTHTLIKVLRRLHGFASTKVELSRCFLLHRRGRKRWCRVTACLFALNLACGEFPSFNCGNRLIGEVLRIDCELAHLFAIQARERSFEIIAARSLECGIDRPVFLGLEHLNIKFAFANQAKGNRLYASRGT